MSSFAVGTESPSVDLPYRMTLYRHILSQVARCEVKDCWIEHAALLNKDSVDETAGSNKVQATLRLLHYDRLLSAITATWRTYP
jgi:hypothetical protein